jgi:nitroreductase
MNRAEPSPAGPEGQPAAPAAAVEKLAGFSLLDALFGRRSRRFGAGMQIPDGPLAYQSKLPPQPLSEAERLLLVAIGAGVSGWNLGIPHTPSGSAEGGCNYPVRPVGRSYPSGAGTHASELLVTDDSGSYITRLRDFDASAIREYAGPADLPKLLEILRGGLVRVSDRRVELPPEFPHISAHNRWVANRPGTSLFIPVADNVDLFLNLLWITIGEGIPLLDRRGGRLLGAPERLFAAGRLRRERAMPLELIEDKLRLASTAELSIAAYNVHLGMEAMGLGGWLYSGLNANTLLGAQAEKGLPGFGFRFARREDWLLPNPVGLDGLFETLVPPYVKDMHEAAQRFAARKFGSGGNFDPARPGPYRDNAAVKQAIDRYDADFVEYLGSLAQDIYDQNGRFPANTPSVGIAVHTQAQHLDLEFYDRFYGEGAYHVAHAEHQKTWHGA